MPIVDAILILGGGITPEGAVQPWVANRLDRAMAIDKDAYFVILSAGTTHKPTPLDEGGFPIFESVVSAAYLIARGIDPARILPETCSYDTIGNAFFARVIHVEPCQFRKLAVVTSQFHMPRTEMIFRWVFGLDHATHPTDIAFEAVPDVGIATDALGARLRRERESMENLRTLIPRITTLRDLHRWLFTEHGAYAAAQITQPPRSTLGKERDTY